MEDLRRAAQEASRKTFTQYLTDCCVLALHESGWGRQRISDFLTRWGKIYDFYFDALRTEAESDYLRQKLDEAIRPLCDPAEPFIPFEARYEFLREITYEGGKGK